MGDCVSSQSTGDKATNAISNAEQYKPDCKEHEQIINKLQKENETLKKQVTALLKELDAADALKDKLMNNRFDDVMVEIDDENKDEKEIDIDTSSSEFWMQMEKKFEQGDIEYFRKLLSSGKFDVQKDFHPDNQQSLLHLAANNGRIEVARMCINLGADLTWPDIEEKEPMYYSEAGSYYHVSQLLMFEKLGGNLGSQIKDNCNTINDQNGIIFYIIENIKELYGGQQNDMLNNIENLMINIIQQKIAFSDDLLMVAWKYSMEKYKHNLIENKTDNDKKFNPLHCPLWKCIAKVVEEITSGSDQRDWYFFKKYLVTSNIWYDNLKQYDDQQEDENENENENENEEQKEEHEEQMIFDEDFDEEEYAIQLERKDAKKEYQKKNKTKYLFYELLAIVNKAAECQSNWLKKPIKDMANNNPNEWKYLSEYKYENELYKANNIRQDVVPNGVKPSYKHEELTKKTNASSSFNPHSYYDINEYLSKLVMAAHFNDESFQQSIMKVFDINKKTNISNSDKKCKYQRGPVKLLERCKAKAGTDYRFEKWPTSAHILDINRCALVFEDIKSLVAGIQLITNMIKNKKAGVIVDICRTKNGFIEYSHNAPTYADVKLNVLIKGKYNSVIGEIQFLSSKMMEFKKRAHSLYGVTRREEFIENMSLVLPTMLDLERTLFVSGNEGNSKALCNIMVTHNKQKEDLVMIDSQSGSNESILHNICWLGHVKAFKFLYSILNKDLFLNRVLLPNRYNDNPIKGIIENKDYEMMNVIFPQTLDTNDKKCKFAIELYDKIKSSKEEIWRIIQHAWTISFDMVQFIQSKLNINEQTMINCSILKESDFDNYINNYIPNDGHENFEGLTWLTSSMIGVDNVMGDENIDALKYILSLVKKNGNMSMMEYLKCGNYMGENIIACCAVQGYYESMKIILEQECKNDNERRELISAVDVDNSTAIHRAMDPVDNTNIMSVIKCLFEPFKDCSDKEKMELLSVTSIMGQNIWTRSMAFGGFEIAKYVYEFCPVWFDDKDNFISRSDELASVLVCCCGNGSEELTKWLLFELNNGKYKKDLIMEFDNDGMTPLTKALGHGNIEVGELILEVFDDNEKKEALEYINHKDKYEFDTLSFMPEILADYPDVLEEVEEFLNEKIKQLET